MCIRIKTHLYPYTENLSTIAPPPASIERVEIYACPMPSTPARHRLPPGHLLRLAVTPSAGTSNFTISEITDVIVDTALDSLLVDSLVF